MRTLVAYGTKYGSTKEIAEKVAKVLRSTGNEADLYDVKDGNKPDLTRYDMVVIGSAIMMGRWTKPAERFVATNEKELGSKKVAVFVCCGDAGNPDLISKAQKEYLDEFLARYPSIRPVSTGLFAGVINFPKYGLLVRTIMKSEVVKRGLSGADVSTVYDLRDWNAVETWAGSLVK
ncbi:MAG: flavodoxin domain-containing protein [Methanomassiliicoccales archaeon]|nr:MAG: flavodoxin domain-containing protein [Methanomassiliicoccales archaeon]